MKHIYSDLLFSSYYGFSIKWLKMALKSLHEEFPVYFLRVFINLRRDGAVYSGPGRFCLPAQVPRGPARLRSDPGCGGRGAPEDLALLVLHGPVRAPGPVAAGRVNLVRLQAEYCNLSTGMFSLPLYNICT